MQTVSYNALHSVIFVVLDCLHRNSKDVVSAYLLQKPYSFYVYRGNLYLMGNFADFQIKELWKLYKEDIIRRLGTKNVYWVKLYAALIQSDIYCKIRINGEIILELSDKLKADAVSWNLEEFQSIKQIVMLVQTQDTRISCPYTSTDIKNYTYEKIRLFENGVDYNSVYNQLLCTVKDESLTSELFYLIPELYCSIVFSDIPTEEGFYFYDTDTHFIYPAQLRSYRHIDETLYEHLKNDNPSREQVMNIIGVSARLKALNAALEKGALLNDIQMSSFVIPMSDYYIIR